MISEARARPLDTFGRLLLLSFALLLAVMVIGTRGCDSAPAATLRPSATSTAVPNATPIATSTVAPTPTAIDLGPPAPEVGRIQDHIDVLSVDIGPRIAGSPREQAVIDYAVELFELWGYEVEVQPFPVESPVGRLRFTSLAVQEPEERELLAVSFDGAGTGEVSSPLVDAGSGLANEFPPEAAGAVVLIQRGDVLFVDMVRRAEEAGAIGVVIANKEPGAFSGALDPQSDMLVVNVEQADGEALRELLAQGPVEIGLNVRTEVTSRNVIARPESGPCTTLSGGHYDSVPWTPSANDNASGSGLVLELARAASVAGISGHCFVLFGAEEMGLFGSAFLASELTEEERDALVAVFNFDVVASDADPTFIGDSQLAEQALALAERLGIPAEIGSLPEDTGSDHSSFIKEGIPAVMLTTPDFDIIHTSSDSVANVDAARLGEIVTLGFALLQETQ